MSNEKPSKGPMKPTPPPANENAPILAFGAHPDDIELGCGGVIAVEAAAGRRAHFVVCSRGESGSHGTPEQRVDEAKKAAEILGASIEFLELDGDAHLEIRSAHAIALGKIVRRIRPRIVLAPSVVETQHPDHWRLGKLARDAVRLARYGNVAELKSLPAHAIDQMFFYALTPESEPRDITPVLLDISDPKILERWRKAMSAHESQVSARKYIDLQLSRSRLHGLHCGVELAAALYPDGAILLNSLEPISHGVRRF